MNRIFLAGDTYGEIDIRHLSHRNFKQQIELTKNDYVIILGDFGLIFNNKQTKPEKYWIDWLNDRSFTTLFVNGNHDNIPIINSFPEKDFMGGTVNRISNSILRLKNGEIFSINNKTFLVMGGATSIDRNRRTEFLDWWSEEVPTYAEQKNAFLNLERYSYKVNYVLSHTIFTSGMTFLDEWDEIKAEDPTGKLLEEIKNRTTFDHWFCGHFHRDIKKERYTVLYENVIELTL